MVESTYKKPCRMNKQKAWECIRKLNTFTIPSIEKNTGMSDKSIRRYVDDLIKGGFVNIFQSVKVPEGKGAGRRITYRLIKDIGVEHPRFNSDGKLMNAEGDNTDRMWRTMKMLKSFTVADLTIHASINTKKVSREEAKQYVQHLYKAGYLAITSPHSTSGTPATYRFIPSKDSGQFAPVVERVKQVYDPNTDKVVYNPRVCGHE